MFAQMIKFQMESQQKKKMRKNSLNFRKKTKKESFSCYKEIRKRNKKKKKKTRKNNNGSSLNCKNSQKHFLKI